MKAYLIDPFVMNVATDGVTFSGENIVREVEYSGYFGDIYKLLSHETMNVETFEGVYLPNGDTIYVDGEGLFKSDVDHWWRLHGFADPIRGRGLVLGVDREGESKSPETIIEHIRSNVMIGSANVFILADTHDTQPAMRQQQFTAIGDHVVHLWARYPWGDPGTLRA